MTTDAWAWVERWDRQQERYLPERELRFSLMLDLIGSLDAGTAPVVLDVCCGNGSISRRVLDRFPNATIVGIDYDPVHLELARRTLGDRVTWHELDLRRPGWEDAFEPASFDAAVSATAIHWFEPDEMVRLYRALADLLRDGGLFLNADHLPVPGPRVAALSASLLDAWQAERLAGAEGHQDFHDAARADHELGPFGEERAHRFGDRQEGADPGVEFHRQALLTAGFREVGEVWRHHSDALLTAVR
jgi:SAM-dependent methyltransferase